MVQKTARLDFVEAHVTRTKEHMMVLGFHKHFHFCKSEELHTVRQVLMGWPEDSSLCPPVPG